MIIAKQPPLGPLTLQRALPFPFRSPNTRLCHSGRTAIWMGLGALGLRAGFRILVPAWHCGSEIDAILAADGIPVLYGLNRELRADPDEIERLLQCHHADAVYLIHYFGYPQPLRDIQAIAQRHGARVIEDLALGLYSTDVDDVPLGSTSDMAVYSLVKSLAVPDGGALWLRDPPRKPLPRMTSAPFQQTMPRLKSLVWNFKRSSARDALAGQSEASRDAWDVHAGFHAAKGAQAASWPTRALVRLTGHAALAQARIETYRSLYAALPWTERLQPLMPTLPDGACPAFFPLWVQDADAVAAALVDAGIEPVRFWRRMHPTFDLQDFPEILALKRQVIRLPIHRLVDADAIARIAAACERAK